MDLIGLIKVDGNYRLHFNSDGQWVVSRLGSPIPGKDGPDFVIDIQLFAEMEVFIQSNSKLPELSTDRWKYPSHKVNLPPHQIIKHRKNLFR